VGWGHLQNLTLYWPLSWMDHLVWFALGLICVFSWVRSIDLNMRFDITQIIDRHIQIHSLVACDVIPLPLTICAILCAPSITHLLILISLMSSLILFYSLKCYQLPNPSILTSKISSSPSIQNYFFSFQSSFFLII